MNGREAAIVSAYTGILCGTFAETHSYIEKIMGRPVFTHEMGDASISAQIKERAKPDFLAMCRDVDTPAPLAPDVTEAVERIHHIAHDESCRGGIVRARREDLRTLLRHVRAQQKPGLTEEQMRELRMAHEALVTNGLDGAAYCLRAAFPGVGKEG